MSDNMGILKNVGHYKNSQLGHLSDPAGELERSEGNKVERVSTNPSKKGL